MEKTETNDTISGQRKRVPFSGPRSRLTVANKDPNYYYYIFNDVDDRIQRALLAGYEFVSKKEAHARAIQFGDTGGVEYGNTDPGDHVSKIVGSLANGQPIRAYLMKLPKALHEEDLRLKHQETLKIDEGLRRGAAGGEREQGYVIKADLGD